MKLRVITSVCLLVALVAAGQWGVQTLSAQVVATPPSASVAPIDAPVPGAEAGVRDVLIDAPESNSRPVTGFAVPGSAVSNERRVKVTATSEVPVISPLPPPTGQFHRPGDFTPTYSVPGGVVFVDRFERKFGDRHASDALRQAAKALRDAKDDAAKTAAQGELNKLLDSYFEDDMKTREAELARVEQRTKDLRTLLDRRRAKKSEIVELQTKVLLNEADGLGFFNESPAPVPFNPLGVRPVPSNAWNATPTNDLVPPLPNIPQPASVPGRPASDLSPPSPRGAESQQTPGQPAADAALGIEP